MIARDGGRHCKEQRERDANEGDRSVVKAICPARRMTLLAIAPTMIAPIGPEPV